MYKVVGFNGQFAVQNLNDGELVKARDKVLAYPLEETATRLRDQMIEEIGKIAEANRYWYVRDKDEEGCFILRRFEL